ncbi:MAG TPA: ribosome biogenesis GTPase YlqF [Bacillales bacterium]|nr:ribosome biogenesis GTPase YlqF [Bacillales bacterium]
MTIQWYPGHMAKTKREVTEKLKQIDVVIELVDARIPYSSSNPLVDQMASGKPRMLLFNKADMADPDVTAEWQRFFRDEAVESLSVNSQTGEGTEQIAPVAEKLMREKREKMKAKGIRPGAIRALILGIPNVGKSTLINRLAGKKAAKIGDRPGITKHQQWIKVRGKLELLDTPGILWPKFEDEGVGLRLAATGAIKDDLLVLQDIALFVLRFLKTRYPYRLKERYGMEELPEDDVALFDMIGKRRGCIVRGGEIDYDRVSEVIVRDLRTGKFGRVSLETPADMK